MLNSVMGSSEKVAFYINFAESLGIQVLPPDINESYTKFTVKGDTIRFGLAAIKNVGINVVESIVKSRKEKGEFESLIDFCNKIDLSTINKRAVESLIKAGTFDSFKIYRSKLLGVYEKVLDGIINQKRRNIDGQISLFGGMDSEIKVPELQYPDIKEFDKKHLLGMEKEMTGLYISGHPLDEYTQSLKLQTTTQIDKILSSHNHILEDENDENQVATAIGESAIINDGERVVLGGIIAEVSRKVTRNNTIMAFMKLEDLTGVIEVIVFPKTLEKVNLLINPDHLVVIRGRVSIKEDELPKLICEDIQPLEKINTSKVYIRVEDRNIARNVIKSLKQLLGPYKGDTPVYIFTSKDKQNFRLAREMWISLESGAVEFLVNQFGMDNVKVID